MQIPLLSDLCLRLEGIVEQRTSVDLNLKNGVFHGGNKTLFDVCLCSFRALSKYEKMIGSLV